MVLLLPGPYFCPQTIRTGTGCRFDVENLDFSLKGATPKTSKHDTMLNDRSGSRLCNNSDSSPALCVDVVQQVVGCVFRPVFGFVFGDQIWLGVIWLPDIVRQRAYVADIQRE